METEEETEKIRRLAQCVRKTETPGIRRSAHCYSRAVYSAFSEIAVLREEGFSLTAIYKVMKAEGLLPEHARLNSFQKAFKKELARRSKMTKTQGTNNPSGGTNKKIPTEVSPVISERKKPEAKVAGREETGAERIKRMTSNTVHIGTGTIIKHADGSFDY